MTAQSWARIVAGEEATIYAYEVLTAELSGAQRNAGLDAILTHRRARDTARSRLARLGESPTSSASYDLPFAVHDVDSAVALAATVELRLADQYLFHVAETTGPERRHASESAQESTTRAVMWGWDTAAFPTGGSAATFPKETGAAIPSPGPETKDPSPLAATDHDGATLQ
jgi:hypothetical protein